MNNPTYNDIRQQVERRYHRVTFFIFHVIFAITALAVMWMLGLESVAFMAAVSTLWVGLLVFHTIKLCVDWLRDRAVEGAWRRYAGDVPRMDEKPKRHLRLTDDAELEVIDDEPIHESLRR